MGVVVDPVPLPPTVQLSLGDLIKNEAEACRRVDTVRSCNSIDQLGQASMEARRALQLLEEKTRYVEQLSAEQDKKDQREYLQGLAQQHRTQLQSLHNTLRRANLEGKQRIDTMQIMTDRNVLIGPTVAGSHPRKATHRQLVKASSEASNKLRQASSLLAQQMKQSMESAQLLEKSSKTLADTHKEMQSFSNTVQDSRRVITKLQRREQTNNLLIVFGLAFFTFTVLYILKRRLMPSLSLFASIFSPLFHLVFGTATSEAPLNSQ